MLVEPRAIGETEAEGGRSLDRSVAAAQASRERFHVREAAARRTPWARSRGTIVRIEEAALDTDALRERIRELRLYWPRNDDVSR